MCKHIMSTGQYVCSTSMQSTYVYRGASPVDKLVDSAETMAPPVRTFCQLFHTTISEPQSGSMRAGWMAKR